MRLLNRTTRSVAPTEAGARLLERLGPALGEVEAALDVVNGFRDRPAGTLRLNVPIGAARLVLPRIVPAFLAAYPEITLEVVAEDSFVDMLEAELRRGDPLRRAAGAGHDRRADRSTRAVFGDGGLAGLPCPAWPARAPSRPAPPRACLRHRFASRAMSTWEFERDGEVVKVDPTGPLIVSTAAVELATDAAVAGAGIVALFEDWLRPHLDSGALEPVLQPWWQRFSGPFLYYPGRRHVPAPLRAFVDFIARR